MRGDGYAMKFGEKLQKLRKENGLSQEQLAEKLNVSRQAISKWEMGTIPDMENVVKIGRYFDCSLDYLMNNELDSKRKQDEQIQKTDVAKYRYKHENGNKYLALYTKSGKFVGYINAKAVKVIK